MTRSIADQARAAVAEADLVLFVVDAQNGHHARRRGARGDPARRAQAGARCSPTRSTIRRRTRLALEFHRSASASRSRSRRCTATTPAICSTRSSRCSRSSARPPEARGRGDSRRDPRPAERRQVVALQRTARQRADDRLGGARDDARLDRHRARAGRAHVRARRHGRPAAQAQAAAGDRVLLGAARARGGRPGRRRARADRLPARGSSRATSPPPTSLERRSARRCRPLEVGPLARSRSRTCGPSSQRRLRQRPPFITISAKTGRGVARVLDKVGELYDKHAGRIPTPELNRFLGELREARQPPSRGTPEPEPAVRRAGRDAAAALPLHRQRPDASSRATTATGSRTSCASASSSRGFR